MNVIVNCPYCGKESNVLLTPEQWSRYNRYLSGKGHIQNALPDLSAEERELLITGICEECWKKLEEDDE